MARFERTEGEIILSPVFDDAVTCSWTAMVIRYVSGRVGRCAPHL